jgi:hypothetical protein
VVHEKTAATNSWQRKAKDTESKLAVERATVASQREEYAAFVSSVQGSCRKAFGQWLNFLIYICLLPLASAHGLQFAGILGAEGVMNEISAPECLGALMVSLDILSVELRAILQYISLTEQILSTYEAVSKYLPKIPMVVDWMKRAAFRHGATRAFAMAMSHYPEGFKADLVSDGYCIRSEGIPRSTPRSHRAAEDAIEENLWIGW